MDFRKLALLLLCGAGMLAQAQVYKWVDENGKVQFSDSPPPNKKAEQVKIRQSSGGFTPPAPTSRAPLDGKGNDEQKELEAMLAASEMAQMKSDCQRLTAELNMLNSADYAIQYDSKGNKTVKMGKDMTALENSVKKEKERVCYLANRRD
jgi:hypothetical protein